MPVAWVKLEYQDREAKRVNLKRKGAERYLKDRLEKRLQRELDGGTVLSRDWTATERDGVLIVSLKADCNEQIGRTLELDGDE